MLSGTSCRSKDYNHDVSTVAKTQKIHCCWHIKFYTYSAYIFVTNVKLKIAKTLSTISKNKTGFIDTFIYAKYNYLKQLRIYLVQFVNS